LQEWGGLRLHKDRARAYTAESLRPPSSVGKLIRKKKRSRVDRKVVSAAKQPVAEANDSDGALEERIAAELAAFEGGVSPLELARRDGSCVLSRVQHGTFCKLEQILDLVAGEAFTESGACRAVGLDTGYYMVLKRRSPALARIVAECKSRGTDWLEDRARERAHKGNKRKKLDRHGRLVEVTDPPSDLLMMFLLKARDRDRFGEKQGTGTDNSAALATAFAKAVGDLGHRVWGQGHPGVVVEAQLEGRGADGLELIPAAADQ